MFAGLCVNKNVCNQGIIDKHSLLQLFNFNIETKMLNKNKHKTPVKTNKHT